MSKYQIRAQEIHSVGDGNTVIIGVEKDNLDTLLANAIKQCAADSDPHKALQRLQAELKDNGALSSGSKGLLDRAVAALPHTDKAAGILNKVVNTLDKLGVLPS